MEEDIKILEELIQKYRDCGTDGYPSAVLDFSLCLGEIEAMIHVIHELRYNKAQFETQLREKLDLQANSVSKTKIKQKIQELKNMRDTTITAEAFNILHGEVTVLEELLETGQI